MLVSCVISFCATIINAEAKQESNVDKISPWFERAPDEVLELERSFVLESDELIKALTNEQKSFAALFDKASVTDEEIFKQAEIVSATHEKLIRSVAQHIMNVQRKLPSPQKKHLMQLCSESVRGAIQRLDKKRVIKCEDFCGKEGLSCQRPSSICQESECCKFCIYRSCTSQGKGFIQKLSLSKEQVKEIKQKDPTYEADVENLRQKLLDERSKLLASFENSNNDYKHILERLDQLIMAHNAIEQRVTKHVVILRSYLTAEQQKWLVGLCLGQGELNYMQDNNR